MAEQPKGPDLREFRPSEFLRARRPELFSDSRKSTLPEISREVFEYHLETLTNRKQEIEFEHFCRKLAQKEICPNLLPQTGPTGGGDSKVDSETYPVADGISLTWYEGIGTEASRERWAFAFSAKKKWRQKVRADVRSIVGTDRGYTRAFFITNQFVSDKERAKLEDELTKAHRVSLRIFDRTWITDTVFRNQRLELAIETLGLTGYLEKSNTQPGPIDTERKNELSELDNRISNAESYRGVEYQLAEDCLKAGVLARNLERPRDEVEGRFARAERVALRVGHRSQLLRIAYEKAWTAFWWYDDFQAFNKLYEDAEKHVIGTSISTEAELLFNLHNVLKTTVLRRHLDSNAAKLDQRTITLTNELDRLAAWTDRPTTALHARSNRLIFNLRQATEQQNRQLLDATFGELREVLQAAARFINFPVVSLANLLQELGQFFVENAAYDDLFEAVVSLLEQRTSEGEAGKRLLDRAIQKLNGGKRYEAIRLFGRAQQKLALEEYEDEHITALVGCCIAYEQAGLLWAARSNMLAATNQSLMRFFAGYAPDFRALGCLQKLVWLEIQLGRIPHALSWLEVARGIAGALNMKAERLEKFKEERQTQDTILGMLFLKADINQLEALASLPITLETHQLVCSRMALLYALGYEDRLRLEGWIPDTDDAPAVQQFFRDWKDQPAKEDLPSRPELLSEEWTVLRSFILGCEVIVSARTELVSLQVAEALLGNLEALLSTSLDSRTAPYRSELNIKVRVVDTAAAPLHVNLAEENGRVLIEVDHRPLLSHATVEERVELHDQWLAMLMEILPQLVILDNSPTYLDKLAKEEAVVGRMLGYADIANSMRNILGSSPKLFLSAWLKHQPKQNDTFPLQRTRAWDNDATSFNLGKADTKRSKLQFGRGNPPEQLFETDSLKHRDQRIASIIDIPKWNEAQWHAVLFVEHPNPQAPPLLGLAFKNEAAAKNIFAAWRAQIGEIDSQNQIGITFVTGVDSQHPADYTVVVGSNLDKMIETRGSGSRIIMISRLCRMHPSSPQNLERFLQSFGTKRCFVLAPAHLEHASAEPKPLFDCGIGKFDVNVKSAWELTENDPDICALEQDAEPVVPQGVTDPPFREALARLAQFRRRHN